MPTFEEELAARRAGGQQPQSSFGSDFAAFKQTQQPEKEEEPWYEDFAEGVAVSGMSTYYGIKDLIVGMDDEDVATLEDWKKDAAESGWGTAGEIVGEIGQLLIPAGVATKGLRVAGAAAKKLPSVLGRTMQTLATKAPKSTAMIGGDVLASASLAAAKTPQEGESRLDSALSGAKDALLGHGAMKVLKKTGKGINITDTAKALMDKGVRLSAGQASKSGIPKVLEGIGEMIPLVSKGIKKRKARATDDWAKAVFNDAAPTGANITDIGYDGMKQLKSSYSKAYDDAWKGADDISGAAQERFLETVVDTMDYVSKPQRNVLNKVANEFDKVVAFPNSRGIQAFDNMIRKEIKKIKPDEREMIDGLKGMREAMREGLPNNVAAKLKEVDRGYAKYLTVKRATAAADETGKMTPKQILSSGKFVGGETAKSLGEAPVQTLGRQGAETLDKSLTAGLLDRWQRWAGEGANIVRTNWIDNLALGKSAPQRAIKSAAQSNIGRILRDWSPSAGKVGYGYGAAEDEQ